MSLKEDIDNSKEARKRGAQGGRPKKTPEVAETEKPEVSGSEKPEVIETKKPGVSGKTRKSKTQSKPNQARPSQVKPERESAHAGAGSSGMLDPPTVEEVDVYAKTNCLNVDAERFVSTYAAQGWLMGNGLPMKDWRAALMKWSVNDETQRKAGKEVTPDAFTAYSNAW